MELLDGKRIAKPLDFVKKSDWWPAASPAGEGAHGFAAILVPCTLDEANAYVRMHHPSQSSLFLEQSLALPVGEGKESRWGSYDSGPTDNADGR